MTFELRCVTLDVTNACNLKCKHCYTGSGYPLVGELSFDEITRLLRDLYDLGVVEIEFSGGEPFIRKDFIKILEAANSLDFSMVILTNGTLLNKNTVLMLRDLDIKCIQIPIEGLRENHEFIRGKGTFERSIKAVKMLKEAGLSVQVRMTVTKRSLDDVEPLSRIVADLGVDSFLVTEFIPVGRGAGMPELVLHPKDKEVLQSILRKIRENSKGMLIRGGAYGYMDFREVKFSYDKPILCGAIRGDWCRIMPNGIVTPCDLIPFYAGNVRLQTIGEIWENSPVFKIFREFDLNKLKGACGTCKYKTVCGGCRALAFLFYGDIYEEDPICLRAQKGYGGIRDDRLGRRMEKKV